MKPGIGVLAYSRPDSLRRCLDSLFDNLRAQVPVAVSFDRWNAEMEVIARSYPVTAITGTKPGVPFANNRLMKHFFDHDAVFLVQDDVRFLRPDWLERYCEALATVPYLAFYDAFYPEDHNRPRHFHVNYRERRVLTVRDGARLWLSHKSPQGAFQAIGRRCIERVGYFDEEFGQYGCEHNDYWRRTCNAGFAAHDRFYDVADSSELLKIDWNQPCSLSQTERTAAYAESERRRKALFELETVGFHRVNVPAPTDGVRIVRNTPPVAMDDIPLPRRGPAFDYWPYPHRLPVLAYHAIADAPGDRYAVPRALLERQLRLLRQHFRFITASQASTIHLSGTEFAKGVAVLSFDDAYTDIMDVAPLLSELEINATIFAPTKWVGLPNDWDCGAFTSRRHLGWAELRELAQQGHEIGSHSVSHVRFSRLEHAAAVQEMTDSKNVLEDRLGQAVHSIAYPFGSISSALAAEAARSYRVGFATIYGTADWTENPHMINRIVVGPDDEAHGLVTRIEDYMMRAPAEEPVAWTSWPSQAPRAQRGERSAF